MFHRPRILLTAHQRARQLSETHRRPVQHATSTTESSNPQPATPPQAPEATPSPEPSQSQPPPPLGPNEQLVRLPNGQIIRIPAAPQPQRIQNPPNDTGLYLSALGILLLGPPGVYYWWQHRAEHMGKKKEDMLQQLEQKRREYQSAKK